MEPILSRNDAKRRVPQKGKNKHPLCEIERAYIVKPTDIEAAKTRSFSGDDRFGRE